MIAFNSNFEILNWQRIKLSDFKTLKLECSGGKTQFENNKINQMIDFVNIFQLEIDHLYIQFNEFNIQKHQVFIDFVIKNLIAKYAEQITNLTIVNFTQLLSKKKQGSSKNGILLDLLLPLKNLKQVQIEHSYQQFQIEKGNMLQEILDVFTSNNQFRTIEYLSIMQDNTEFEDESFRSKKNEMMRFQNKIIQMIATLKSLKNLQISILNMNFNQDFYKSAYQKITEMESLEQVGLDLWSKNCSLKQQIQNLKYLTKFAKSLKEITFLSDNYCKPGDIKQLKELLLQFENIEDLCIKGVKFQQKPQLESFLSYFNSYNNLKNITLDFSDSPIDILDMNQLLYQNLKDCSQIEELNLVYPSEHFFSKKDYLDLQTLLFSMEKTLKYLSFQVSVLEDCKEGYETFRNIINLKNLKIFQFQFEDNVIKLDAVKDEVENVRRIKTFLMNNYEKYTFLINVEFNILFQMQDLKNLQINERSLPYMQFSLDNLINHLQQFQLESFTIIHYYQQMFQNEMIKIINMNKLSLKHLNCYLYDRIETLPNVISIKTYGQSPEMAYNILKKLPSIVRFDGSIKPIYLRYPGFYKVLFIWRISQYQAGNVSSSNYLLLVDKTFHFIPGRFSSLGSFNRFLKNILKIILNFLFVCLFVFALSINNYFYLKTYQLFFQIHQNCIAYYLKYFEIQQYFQQLQSNKFQINQLPQLIYSFKYFQQDRYFQDKQNLNFYICLKFFIFYFQIKLLSIFHNFIFEVYSSMLQIFFNNLVYFNLEILIIF
ncbi:transmembrane protein, putative (macronuclear) [Tetrahymena thermophila SB210]|uniref:Transmembrane protein, putative n=1 Tax=Tetrahymena thermophila (strain SB210) TaxID=312017 RepID=Q23FV8_TETTS|nr:transmembrane protein, putative [Tetrahymena thermophila SB210]EAR95502.2 transmembrane protein, putative [Tetrahymena thermophila SB210]|eukprot:XP_001015747.2 transmembrane protein, putative [Tetrahymena thermophila SB210]